MQIAFDAKRAVQNRTGLGNYSRYILDILCRFYPDNSYILYAPKYVENAQLDALLKENPGRLSMHLPSGFWQKCPSLWRTFGIPADLRKDGGIAVFHGLSNELPLNIRRAAGVKTVVTLHDLIFRRMPDCYQAADRLIYDYKYRRSCEAADVVVAVSECTKRDAVELWHIPEEKIKVVYQGCDVQFTCPVSEAGKEAVRRKYNLPARYILSVGSIERRKNALAVVKALPRLLAGGTDIQLVLVGRQTAYTAEIREWMAAHHLDNQVHILSSVTFPDLPAVYQMADVFVYPSRYEGFGIPLLEAMHSGVPVIAATGSCLEEAGGPDSIYVSPDDIAGLTAALQKVLTDTSLRSNMIEKSRLYATRFSEETQARQLMNIYRSLCESESLSSPK